MANQKVTLMKGNEAIAHACIRCGADGFFGYPITPQSEIIETLALLKPWETSGMVVLQAESEVAAINMVYGGAGAGKRVITTSSSPGVALMQEGISYMAGAEIPGVIVNVQRGGPGLGTIQPSQSDYFQATRGGGNGDYNVIVLAPASVQEMNDFVVTGVKALTKEQEILSSRYGLSSQDYHFLDGSGGGDTTATTEVVTTMLDKLQSSSQHESFLEALPVLAVDGSLGFVTEFQADPSLAGAAGQVRAKTGTYVTASETGMVARGQAFGGYITTRSGRNLVYLLAVNEVPITAVDDLIKIFQDQGTISAILWRDL